MVVTVKAVHDLVQEFLTRLIARKKSPHTVKRYRGVLEELVLFLEQRRGSEPFDLAHLDKATLTAFLEGRTLAGSKNTFNTRLSAVRSFFEHLYKDEKIDANPAKRIEHLKVYTVEPNPLTLDEFIRLVTTVENEAPDYYKYRYVAVLQVLYHTSLRVNEVVSLNLGQVHHDPNELRSVKLKGAKEASVVEFNDVVAEALERWLRDRARMQLAETEQAVFVSDRGTRLAVRTVEEMVRRYAESAGIRDATRRVTPHLLRHSSASEHTAGGVDIRVIQDMLHHESVTTTQRYTHVRSNARRGAVDGLGERYRTQAATAKRTGGRRS